MNIGNPIFKFTLNNSIDGILVISEPDGWNKSILKLERHDDYHSLIEYFTGSFIFYGNNGNVNGGLEYIRSIERAQGFEATITILIEISFDAGENYNNVFNGQLDLTGIQEVKDNKIDVPIIRNDFWTKFILRNEIPVDIGSLSDLDGNSVLPLPLLTLNLTSQKIINKYESVETEGLYLVDTGPDYRYMQYQPDTVILDEIENTFKLGRDFTDILPVWIQEFVYAGETTFDIRYETSRTSGDGFFSPRNVRYAGQDWRFWFKLNDLDAIEFSAVDAVYTDPSVYTSWDSGSGISATDIETMVATYSTTISIKVGDVVRIYMDLGHTGNTGSMVFWGINGQPTSTLSTFVGACARPSGMISIPSFLNVTQNSVFPATQSDCYFVHDIGYEIIKRTVGDTNAFYSEFLGSTQTIGRSYIDDGCAWLFTLIRGLQLRQYTMAEKPFSISFKQFWEGLNPIFNLGLCYETVSSNEVVRLEDKVHFYDNTSVSVNIDNVRDIVREYDASMIFNKIEVGYNKGQDEIASGLDDPQTKHTYATIIKKIKNSITLYSDFIAASLAIENTRRTTRAKSADYKFDDDTFIIAIKEVANPVFTPELDENFDSVTNLFNSETRYNLSLTPLRNLIRWYNYLSGCLQRYLSGSFIFSFGEGNCNMQSDYSGSAAGICYNKIADNLAENGNLSLSYNSLLGFLHLPELFTITIDLSWEDYLLIRTNHKKAIGVSQTTTGHKKFFIKSLEYTICEAKAKIIAWPAEEFIIQIIQ